MSNKPTPVPSDQTGPSPYLIVRDGFKALEFYQQTLGARLTTLLEIPKGSVGHAELRIGSGVIMVGDESPEMGAISPETLGGSPVTIHLYVEDVDAAVERMVARGATVLRPVADQFYGDRGGKLRDPFGHIWWLASRKEVLSPDEIRERAMKLFGS